MKYYGVNLSGKTVIPECTSEQMEDMRKNPAYKFVRFFEIKETPQIALDEVENVEEQEPSNIDNGDTARAGNSRKNAGKASK